MNKMGGMCLNWKVIAGLAAVGLGIWVVAPNFVGAALPFLIVLACPLSMLFMMRGMGSGQCALDQCATEEQQARRTVGIGLTRDQQVAQLKAQFADIQDQQQAIARELSTLEGASMPVVRERAGAAAASNGHLASRS